MNAEIIRLGFDSDEELFRYHLGQHGADRSLSALWHRFHGTAAIPAPVPAAPLLQHPE